MTDYLVPLSPLMSTYNKRYTSDVDSINNTMYNSQFDTIYDSNYIDSDFVLPTLSHSNSISSITSSSASPLTAAISDTNSITWNDLSSNTDSVNNENNDWFITQNNTNIVDTAPTTTKITKAKRVRNTHLSRAERIELRKQKHATTDAVRRSRMKSLMNELQELSHSTSSTDQTTILQNTVEQLKALQLQNQQLHTQLQQQQQQYTSIQPNSSRYLYDIRSLSTSFDSLGIAIERCDMNGTLLEINKTGQDLLYQNDQQLVGTSICDRPTGMDVVSFTCYHIQPEQLHTYRQLCRAQNGCNMYITNNIDYYSAPLMSIADKNGTEAQTQEFLYMIEQIFRTGHVFHSLMKHVYTSGLVTESIYTATPIYKADNTPDHLVIISTADLRRTYYIDVNVDTFHLK